MLITCVFLFFMWELYVPLDRSDSSTLSSLLNRTRHHDPRSENSTRFFLISRFSPRSRSHFRSASLKAQSRKKNEGWRRHIRREKRLQIIIGGKRSQKSNSVSEETREMASNSRSITPRSLYAQHFRYLLQEPNRPRHGARQATVLRPGEAPRAPRW